MKESKAYDLPIRILHWTFAVLFILSFSIAYFIDDDSILYAYHKLSGILMACLVVIRIFWGIFGSKTAKFNSFLLKPKDLIAYFQSIVSSKSQRHLGHNPASSYAAVSMYALTLGLVFSGIMMSLRIAKHTFEEVHEILAYGFLITTILHIAGVVLHHIKHKDGLLLSMYNGKKNEVAGEEEISSYHPIAGVFVLVLVVFLGAFLISSFDVRTGNLSVFGTQLKIGEEQGESQSIDGDFKGVGDESEHDEQEKD